MAEGSAKGSVARQSAPRQAASWSGLRAAGRSRASRIAAAAPASAPARSAAATISAPRVPVAAAAGVASEMTRAWVPTGLQPLPDPGAGAAGAVGGGGVEALAVGGGDGVGEGRGLGRVAGGDAELDDVAEPEAVGAEPVEEAGRGALAAGFCVVGGGGGEAEPGAERGSGDEFGVVGEVEGVDDGEGDAAGGDQADLGLEQVRQDRRRHDDRLVAKELRPPVSTRSWTLLS